MRLSTLKRKIVIFIVNHFLSGTYAFKLKRDLLNSIGYTIGLNTKIVGPIYNTATFKVGENTWIGRNFTVEGNGMVTIGSNCDIAPSVSFQTGGHEIGSEERRAGTGRIFNIQVEDGTWIGACSTILGNTTIGRSCFITSCACVTEDIPANSMAGGVPAKVIRKLDYES